MNVRFRWDPQKAVRNAQKHDVTFVEAATVFQDPLAHIFDDEAHSEQEHRELIIGHSSQNRLLIVSFTEQDNLIRIISAEKQIEVNVKTMKTPNSEQDKGDTELREHYDFDYRKAKPNRFADQLSNEAVMVVLEPEVAEAFPTTEAVNEALRLVMRLSKIPAMQSSRRRKGKQIVA